MSEEHNRQAKSCLAIDQRPTVGMIKHDQTGLLCKLSIRSPDVQRGLGKLGVESGAVKQQKR